MDYAAFLVMLKAEIANDPMGLGYAGKTDTEIADLLNDATRCSIDRTIIPAWEVIEATVPAEWAALTSAEKQRYQILTGAGEINVQGTNTRAAFLAMFGAGTATRANLAGLQRRQASRAEELGWDGVAYWDVARARALGG